jgi:hypothetical protein
MPGKELVYGLSITDACVGWEDTGKLVDKPFASAASRRRLKPKPSRRDSKLFDTPSPFVLANPSAA